eukprot:672388-Pelagomonas_calceolata.AAC.1
MVHASARTFTSNKPLSKPRIAFAQVNKKQKKSNAGPSNSNPRPTQGRAPEGSAEEKRRQIVAAKKRLQADEAELKQ